jgi:beta-barrel assembly-enhancing protease
MLCAVSTQRALARIAPASMAPVIPPGYEPKDIDERGLWDALDRLEEQISTSNFLLKNQAVADYVRGVTDRIAGDYGSNLRVYVVRNPDFNASMAPNGMMIVHTGLLARVRDEAQLAVVLAHEAGHYMRRHSVQSWRDFKTKSAIGAIVSVAGAGAGSGWYELANAINFGILTSLFTFSRGMESEADALGLKLLAQSGYAPSAAGEIWQQLTDEFKASAAARKKRYRDRSRSILSTHPPTSERMADLNASAQEIDRASEAIMKFERRREQFLAAIAPIRFTLLDEQVKLNNPGASLYLIDSLAKDGWSGTLRFFQGEAYRLRDEVGDSDRAATGYAEAVAMSDAPPEAYRAHGYAQIKRGNRNGGRAALQRYLELKPDAADAAMIKFSLEQ